MAKKKSEQTPAKPPDEAKPAELEPAASKPYARAGKEEIARRVEAVLRIRLDGAQLHDIIEYAAQQSPPWNVSERQISRYIEAADALISRRRTKKRRLLIDIHLARRESLYARAVNAADYGTALRVLDSMAVLQKLHFKESDLREVNRRLAELEKRFGIVATRTETRLARVAQNRTA